MRASASYYRDMSGLCRQDQQDHQAVTRPTCLRHEPNGTFTRDKDGIPADLLNIRDYPVCSTCCLCGVEIITYGILGRAAEWYDVKK